MNDAYYRRVRRPPPTHGLNGYNNYRCRCETCRKAKAADNQRYWQRAK
ncbi:MAG TPA: hypothetical protein VLL25_14845 [Acidimicrobiales bacterium]|nr:hypothetical protein [Acidimicrobiales bacterium]